MVACNECGALGPSALTAQPRGDPQAGAGTARKCDAGCQECQCWTIEEDAEGIWAQVDIGPGLRLAVGADYRIYGCGDAQPDSGGWTVHGRSTHRVRVANARKTLCRASG